MVWPFTKTYRVKCPDGTIRVVYRDVNEAFPLYIKGWQSDINAGLKGLQQIDTQMNLKYASMLHGVLFELDDLNKNTMLDFKTAYEVYKINPCVNDQLLSQLVSSILAEQQRLRHTKIKIQGLISIAQLYPNDGEKVFPILRDIITEIGGPSLPNAVLEEIASTRIILENDAQEQHNGSS